MITFKSCMNQNKIKELHHAGRLPASGVSQLDIEYHHNEWCRVNGYPVTRYRPQAGRLQASSIKRQAVKVSSDKPQAPGCKRQAPSHKRQAARH